MAGSTCDAVEGLEEGKFALFLAWDVWDVKEENEASETEAPLRGERRTGGGDLCTTMATKQGSRLKRL